MQFYPRRTVTLGCALLLALGSVGGVSAQTPHPLHGTWKLNLAKSTYGPTSTPAKSGTTRFEFSKDGILTILDGIDSQGRVTHAEYTARLDGKDYPYKGTIDGRPDPSRDAVAWLKTEGNAYEFVYKLKGEPVRTVRGQVAADGKSRKNTFTGKNAQGQPTSGTEVYEKQ